MPGIWDTNLPDMDAEQYANLYSKDEWWDTVFSKFFPSQNNDWHTYWNDNEEILRSQFYYPDKYGNQETLARRTHTKGLLDYQNQMQNNLGKMSRGRGTRGFAGAGGGLGIGPKQTSLWDDYMQGMKQKQQDLASNIYGYKEKFKSELLDYVQAQAQAGEFD